MLCSIWEAFSIQTRDTGGNETEQPLLEPVSCSDWPCLVLHAHCDPFLHLSLFCTKLHSHSHKSPFELLLISCLCRIVSPSGITYTAARATPFVRNVTGDVISHPCAQTSGLARGSVEGCDGGDLVLFLHTENETSALEVPFTYFHCLGSGRSCFRSGCGCGIKYGSFGPVSIPIMVNLPARS